MLEHLDAAHYLLSLGVVKPRAVLEENLTVVDVSRRNRVFVVSTRAGPAYVVKQAGSRGEASLAHEVAMLRQLARVGALAGRVPAVVHYDPRAALAVLCTAAGARDWTVHHRRRFPLLGPRALGHVLGELQGISIDAPLADDSVWASRLSEPSHEMVLGMSTGAQELVAQVQSNRALCDRLDSVRDAITNDGFVHGDVRWDNCLAVAGPGARRRTRIVLVDWESAGRGPAAVDAATVLAEYLAAWVESVPIPAPHDPGRLLARAQRPLRRMQPAIRAFWAAYRATAGDRRRCGRW